MEMCIRDSVQAVFIAQIEPTGIVGVVRGAHGVHVVLLHQADVLEQGFHGRNVAQQRMRIVPVDAQELNWPAIHPEPVSYTHLDVYKRQP